MTSTTALQPQGQTLRRRTTEIVWWAIVAQLFVLASVLGSLASLIVLILALLLSLLIDKPSWLEGSRQPLGYIFVTAFLVMAASFVATAREPYDAINTFNFIPMLLAVAIYAMAREKGGERLLRIIATLCLVGAVAAMVIGAFEVFLLDKHRAGAMFNNEIVYGRTGLLLGFLALIGFLLGGKHRLWFLIGPIAGACVLVLSGTRGGMVALPIILLIALTAVFVATGRSRRVAIFGLGGLVVVSMLVVSLQAMTNGRLDVLFDVVSAILTGEGTVDNSTAYRLEMYAAGIAAFLERPLWGYGWANLTAAAAEHMAPDRFRVVLGNQNHLHNDLLNFAVAAGLPGIACFLAFLGAPLVQLVRQYRKSTNGLIMAYAVTLIVATYAITGLFDMTLGYDISTTFYAFALAIILGATARTEPPSAL
ncbi:O-antigen ligase family protein [Pelagibacterium sp.]|uniref:O-antigen ligase family protein n=1 Tax=Pelagibacterium sp. TaxID=1967288 RepID=UPI003BAABB4C